MLHRDVSVNNILIVDKDVMRSRRCHFTGFLHDFDCAWFSESEKTPCTQHAESTDTETRDSDSKVGAVASLPLPRPVDERDEAELKKSIVRTSYP